MGRWQRAIAHIKAEQSNKDDDEHLRLSRQFNTGISCGCKCRVAPSDEFKAVAAAAVAASRGGNSDAMRPKRSVKSKKEKKREEKLRMEKKKILKKSMLVKEQSKKKNEKDLLRKKMKKEKYEE